VSGIPGFFNKARAGQTFREPGEGLLEALGLFRPDTGHVAFEGQVVQDLDRTQLAEVRKSIGMCFQMAALFDSMSVEENVGFALIRHTKMTLAQRAERVEECLNMVGLKDTQKLRPAELSG